MRKHVAILSLGLLLWTSCEQDSFTETNLEEQEVIVQFNVSLRQEISPFRTTRAIPGNAPEEPTPQKSETTEEPGSGTEVTQPTTTLTFVDYAVYDAEGTYLRHARKEINVGPDGSAQFSLQESFTAGIYKISFLAHSVEDAQFSEETNVVTFPKINDTFWGNEEFEIEAGETNQSFSFSIQRAIAGVEFLPSDEVPEQVHHFNIETSCLYNTINLLDGTTSDATIPLNYSYIFTAEDRNPGTLVSQIFYTFVPEKDESAESSFIDAITLSALTEEEEIERTRILTNVPIYQNKITRYTGTLYTARIVDGEFSVNIDSEWDGYIDEVLEE